MAMVHIEKLKKWKLFSQSVWKCMHFYYYFSVFVKQWMLFFPDIYTKNHNNIYIFIFALCLNVLLIIKQE